MPVTDLPGEGDFNPVKGGGGGGTPGGGGSPGPGGGFGGGFGGFGGQAFAMKPNTANMAFGLWPKRKMVWGPNGPVPVSLSPMVSDSVPAMLSPGEGVLNNGAMAQPGMENFLNMANQQGVQAMAEGGVVPGMEGGMGGGGLNRDMLLKLLSILLDDSGGMGQGEVPGFAYGGRVGQQGGFTQPQTMTGKLGQRTRSFGAPRPPAAPPTMAPAPPTVGPSTTGRPDPWGDNPFAPGSLNPGDEWNARMQEMLKQFGQFGSFSPQGSQGVMQAVQHEATQNADALRRRAATNADVSGLDAGQRGSYAMQSDLNTQGDVANILSNAQREQLLGQQQFGQNMLGKMTDAQMQAWLARLASWMGGG